MTRLVEDKDLRERFKRGEVNALRDVYRHYVPVIADRLRHGFVFRTQAGKTCRFQGFKDPGVLENALQEVFCRAFGERARLAYDGLRPYHNYLFTIARNFVADEHRRSAPGFVDLASDSEIDESNGESAILRSPSAQPDHAYEDQEIQKHVNAFIASLTPLERAIFQIRLQEGTAIEETAMRLETTTYRVKRTEKRLCQRFFQVMRKHGYLEGYKGPFAGDAGRAAVVLLPLLLGGMT